MTRLEDTYKAPGATTTDDEAEKESYKPIVCDVPIDATERHITNVFHIQKEYQKLIDHVNSWVFCIVCIVREFVYSVNYYLV